ncbi:hypothetical protein RSA3_07685 [Microbacterium testaceum]|uniref:Carbohydrate kinase PfkB domain-containing protein n=2 Tax=Microbacterium testaceum TaxID=2033 RepID=A0A147F8F5_MICTE|nr:hypothetical protein RSA3_07685 [Microbacterium testaceum]KTS90633.1 hypothetical protein NS183_08045 [Microbacterium testaceum]
MALLRPGGPRGRLGRAASVDVAGAESNVAVGLAQLGHEVAWAGRLGDDDFGSIVAERLRRQRVSLRLAEIDPELPTGLIVKRRSPRRGVQYYRRGSAGSLITTTLVDAVVAQKPRVVHLSGVTPALSPEARAAVVHAVESELAPHTITSFDVNYRPLLWSTRDEAATTLRRLAGRATVVFVGLDEADALWGAHTADDVRRLLPAPRHLIVKDAAVGATEFHPEGRTHTPAFRVRIRDVVGAGDAFAAGWLHGWLTGAAPADRVNLGHVMAGRALRSHGDFPSRAISPTSARRRALRAARRAHTSDAPREDSR